MLHSTEQKIRLSTRMKPSFVSTTQRHSGLLQRSLITHTPIGWCGFSNFGIRDSESTKREPYNKSIHNQDETATLSCGFNALVYVFTMEEYKHLLPCLIQIITCAID